MYRYCLNPVQINTLSEKIEMCRRLCIPMLELDGTIDGVPFAELNFNQIEDARQALIEAGVAVVLATLNCPTDDDLTLRSWFQNAHFMAIENVLMPAPGENETVEAYAARLEKPCAYAESYGMGSLVTHAPSGTFADEENLTQLVKLLGNVHTIMDPALQASLGKSAYFQGFYKSRLKNYISFVRASDGMKDGVKKLPGQGVAQFREFVSLLLSRSFNGYFSITPYANFTAEDVLVAVRKELKNM